MAIFSTHLLNSIDGTHASDVEIIIYKSNNDNKVVFLEDKTDNSGRMLKEFELTKEDCESDYEMIINSGKSACVNVKAKGVISQIVSAVSDKRDKASIE